MLGCHVLQPAVHCFNAGGGYDVSDPAAADWDLWMQLEAFPVQLELEFSCQPDQTASLSDEAKRSDEVAIEDQLHDFSMATPRH